MLCVPGRSASTDASGIEGVDPPSDSTERPRVRLLVVDDAPSHLADLAIHRALSADPPVPIIVHAPTHVDVDHLEDRSGITIVADEDTGREALKSTVIESLSGDA